MNPVERIIDVCEQRSIPISRMERELGFSNGSIKKLKNGRISWDRVQKIADYLGLSTDYLLTGKEEEPEESKMASLSGTKYYFSDETAQVAQEIFEKPGLWMLFDAARDAKPEDLITMANLLERLKKTNPEG